MSDLLAPEVAPTPLELARAEAPDDRLVEFVDTRAGNSFVMRIPPTSPWHELLPPEQSAEIRAAQ